MQKFIDMTYHAAIYLRCIEGRWRLFSIRRKRKKVTVLQISVS